MPKVPSVRRSLALAAASAVLLTGACKSPLASDKTADKKPAATPSGSSSAASTDNGVAAKPAAAIVQDALAALGTAKAVRIRGRMRSDGDMIRLSMRSSPTTFAGFLRGPIAGRTATIEMRQVNGKVYGRYNGTWKAVGSSREAAAHDADFTTTGLAKLIKPQGRLVKGKPTTIGGLPAIGVRDSDGWLYVATTGKPYPLRIGSAKNRQEAVNFTEYDKPFKVVAPTAS